MSKEEPTAGKKEISPEGQETLDSIRNGILKDAERAGLPRDKWFKAVARLAKASNKKLQKLKHSDYHLDTKKEKFYPTGITLSKGVRIKAQTCEEVLVELLIPDNDTRTSALTLFGKAAGYAVYDEDHEKPPAQIIIHAPDDQVKIMPEGENK